MHCKCCQFIPFLTILAVVAIGRVSCGDEIHLRGGGTVRGRLEKASRPRDTKSLPPTTAQPREITITTLSGARLTFPAAEVESLVERPVAHEEYLRRADSVADTVEARWQLAEWCRAQNLDECRKEQLERIVELEPTHKKAHYALGHSQIDGKWVSRDNLLRERGLVKYKGRYVSVEELRVLEQVNAIRKEEREWFAKIRRLHILLKGTDPDRSKKAIEDLLQVSDPNAARALKNFLNGDEDRRIRSLYVDVLLNIPGPNTSALLVESSLYDVDGDVRSRALDGMVKHRSDVGRPLYVRELSNPRNEIVRRAGAALELIGDAGTVPPLIEALVTTHQYQINVPRKDSISFTADGGFAPQQGIANLPPGVAAGLLTGQYPNGVIIDTSNSPPPLMQTVDVSRDEQNPEVLSALEHLTGQSFGYDKAAWRIWRSSQKSSGVPAPSRP